MIYPELLYLIQVQYGIIGLTVIRDMIKSKHLYSLLSYSNRFHCLYFRIRLDYIFILLYKKELRAVS
nr:MAG TPA: hypothetical protein [Caudoviricetes sp.]